MSDATAAYRAARDWLLDTSAELRGHGRGVPLPGDAGPVQLGVRLVRRGRRGQRRAGAGGGRGGRVEHGAHLRRAAGTLPRGVGMAGRSRGPARRLRDRDARQPGGAVGVDARDHAARCGRDADHHRGRPCRAGRPDRAGSGAARDRGRRGHGQVRRRTGRLHADQRRPDRRRSGRLAHLRRRVRRRPGRRRPRRHGARRPAAALLHVRHHEPAQAGRAHAGLLPRRPPVDDVLARRAPGRRAPQHLLRRLGQARVVVLLRTVDRGGDDRGAELRPLRRRRPCCGGCASSRSPRSARRRRSGGC